MTLSEQLYLITPAEARSIRLQ